MKNQECSPKLRVDGKFGDNLILNNNHDYAVWKNQDCYYWAEANFRDGMRLMFMMMFLLMWQLCCREICCLTGILSSGYCLYAVLHVLPFWVLRFPPTSWNMLVYGLVTLNCPCVWMCVRMASHPAWIPGSHPAFPGQAPALLWTWPG